MNSEPYPMGILVEAESFDDFGGWVMDSQFENEMGSPYLLAHGNGTPVADANTVVSIPNTARYNVCVRAKDWVFGHHPGRFTLSVGGERLPTEFGQVNLAAGDVTLALHDLTGFCGRCDAIFFTTEDTAPPAAVNEASRAWRRRLRGLPEEPVDGGSFDVVVVGGGVAGTAAALTAARLGQRVALVVEIGLSPRGWTGPLVDEFSARTEDGDLLAVRLLEAEPTATVFLEHTVYHAVTSGSSIKSIDARHARSGRETRISAPVFIDGSGTAVLGRLSGAETLYGQESRAEYGESLAPVKGDTMHHGNTVFFRTKMADSPVFFPAVPWATEVAKDYTDLRGQLRRPGRENGPGPVIVPPGHVPDPTIKGRLTHFWEYGQWLDPYTQGEHIRDHLLRAIYGTFSNVKTIEPDTYANLALDWVAFVPAQGEHHRYKGDYVLTETDIRTHKPFPDAVVQNDGAFCLHYPGDEKYDFQLKHWEWDERDKKPYDIPFRCLYSVNVSNLMMAGKHMSATHVANSNTKFMGNGGHHGIATAVAAFLCRKYGTTPRGVYQSYLDELKTATAGIARENHYGSYRLGKGKESYL
ncbi:FAD dependent oxidoreductase [Aspergillus candidus]|uniref:FAD dependent oxidoreductase n=1 Tax=Aspergillus candidus TaxID=41067 RepID=A0A2I2FP13_ASPCN|nr:FAD dependent oxidoreductase [Aspergillus candidus]PLB42366.1 FAD dependent oxidoreductase [Aspergillus candidus]